MNTCLAAAQGRQLSAKRQSGGLAITPTHSDYRAAVEKEDGCVRSCRSWPVALWRGTSGIHGRAVGPARSTPRGGRTNGARSCPR